MAIEASEYPMHEIINVSCLIDDSKEKLPLLSLLQPFEVFFTLIEA
jgi:hypothetical protein